MTSNPLDDLIQEQKDKINELRQITNNWDLKSPEKEFIDDPFCLFRYLKGLNWDINMSQSQLKETIEWRQSYCPQNITYEDVEPAAKLNYIQSMGNDLEGRPIMYLLFGKDTLDNSKENINLKIKYIVYMVEQTIKKMSPNVYNITWIFDLKDTKITIATIKSCKSMFSNLGNYYTERLFKTFIINSSWTLRAIWVIVEGFLAKETREKYIFIKNKSLLDAYIDKNQLLVD